MKKTIMTTEEIKSAIIQCEQCLFDLKKKWDEEKPKKVVGLVFQLIIF